LRCWPRSVALGLLLVAALPVGGEGAGSVNIPINDPRTELVERVALSGLVDSALLGTRPFSRLEAARIVAEALRNLDRLAGTDTEFLEAVLLELREELRPELITLGALPGERKESFLIPVERAGWRVARLQRHAKEFPEFVGTRVIEGTPLLQNREGIIYQERYNAVLDVEGRAQWTDRFSFYLQPLVFAHAGAGEEGAEFRLHKGYAKATLGPIELEAGKDSVWWGPGRHGAFVLTNNAEPLEMVKLSNPSPVILPWILKYLGHFQFTLLLARLDEQRQFPNPLLFGLRLGLKPHRLVEIGISRTVRFGGRGEPGIKSGEFVDLLTGADEPTNADQVGSVDLSVRIPPLWGLVFYTEIGRDTAGAFSKGLLAWINAEAFLLGLYFPSLWPGGRTDLRIELADTGQYAFWYRTGHTFKGQILGHHIAGDATDYFVETSTFLTENLRMALTFDWERRGVDDLPTRGKTGVERDMQVGLGFRYRYLPTVTIEGRYAFEHIENFNLNAGESATNHLVEFGVSLSWPVRETVGAKE
jgi:hypothetical protein